MTERAYFLFAAVDEVPAVDAALQRLVQYLAEIDNQRQSVSTWLARLLSQLREIAQTGSAGLPHAAQIDGRVPSVYAGLEPCLRLLDLPRPWHDALHPRH